MKLRNDDRIDEYLTGELKGKEREAFESDMSKDEALRMSVEFYREVALSAARVHDLEVLQQHRQQSFKYRWQLFWARFRLAIISAISAIGIAAAGIGADAIMAVQRFFQASSPYITQLVPAVARDGGSQFDEIDSLLNTIQTKLEEKDFENAQACLDKVQNLLSGIKQDGLYSENDFITYTQAAEFTQAVIYAQEGKGVKARKFFRQIASQDSHIYRDDAMKILER